MEKINVESDYKEKLLKIWNDFSKIQIMESKEYRMIPIAPKYIKKNALLFIGVNPSLNEKDVINSKIVFYPEYESVNKALPYFEKFKDISEYCENFPWTHLDLFFLRETNQKIIENLSYDKDGGIDFLIEQLKISFDIIKKSNPKIIIVSNALASEFFGKKKKNKHKNFEKIWEGYDLCFTGNNFNEKIGTYVIELNGKKTPIIFSGMLSGKRALDNGSFERLKWQIKMILSFLKNNPF